MIASTSFHIQPLSVADAPLLAEIALQSYREHYLHLWYDNGEWYTKHSFSIELLQKEIANSDSRFFLIYSDVMPVGFLKLNINIPAQAPNTATFTPPANSLELERIYFLKEATGRGLGSSTLMFVDNFAREHGKTTIILKAMDSSQDAIMFYRKNGFEEVGTYRLNFPQMKTEFKGMVILAKSLLLS